MYLECAENVDALRFMQQAFGMDEKAVNDCPAILMRSSRAGGAAFRYLVKEFKLSVDYAKESLQTFYSSKNPDYRSWQTPSLRLIPSAAVRMYESEFDLTVSSSVDFSLAEESSYTYF